MSDWDFNDLFKTNLPRPEHEDFWQLSSIVLDLDASMTEGLERGERPDDILAKKIAEVGDSYSFAYMATQRAYRVHGIQTVADLMRPENMEAVIKTATVYMEAMVVGARFHERK